MSYLRGRVIGQEKDRYRVLLNQREWPAIVRGRAHLEGEFPVVGDDVECSLSGELAVIEVLLPRRSLLARQAPGEGGVQKIAANVDFVLVATSYGPDLSLTRLERYAALIWDAGAVPVIVLTKRDLAEDWEERLDEVAARLPGVDVLAIGLEDDVSILEDYLRDGRTVAVLGSSGVGKSTLINRLLGEERAATGGIRESDGKGRHTTTSRSMWPTPFGGWIVDTPGMRELGLVDHEDGLERTFADVADLMERCRFTDCAHESEPGCAVKAALANGALSSERWESYRKLERELAFQRRKGDPAAMAEERKRWRRIHRMRKNR